MNTEDQEEIPEECTKAAAELMKLMMEASGINLTPSPEKQREEAEFMELIRQRQANQLAFEHRVEQIKETDPESIAISQTMFAEAWAWRETIVENDTLNTVSDGYRLVRLCSQDGNKCTDSYVHVENNRLVIGTTEDTRNRSRELVNGLIIVDSTGFDGPKVDIQNMYCFLMSEES